MRSSTFGLILSAALLAAPPSQAAAPAQPAAAPATATQAADPRVAIAAKLGKDVKPEDLKPSAIPGIYEYMRGTDALYVSSDGRYAVLGDLYETVNNTDLTDARRRETRLKLLSGIPESQMVVFGPADAKHTITVFTDMDCQYCRRLHSQIDQYNKLGIRVRYIAYPRTGPNTESWTKAVQVWCSADRKTALTQAKLGKALSTKPCQDNPVQAEYDLGQKFDLQGTPTLVLANGDVIPGYMEPQDLANQLKGVPN